MVAGNKAPDLQSHEVVVVNEDQEEQQQLTQQTAGVCLPVQPDVVLCPLSHDAADLQPESCQHWVYQSCSLSVHVM